MSIATLLLLLVLGAAVLAIALVPARVRYTETLVIDAPARVLYDNTRLQRRLMDWSAWPSETKSMCTTENDDGVVGARTVYFSEGRRFGHQEVTRLVDGTIVELHLFSKGPPQRPVLRFEFVPLSASRTEVHLHFKNTLVRPFNLILRIIGIVRWTRRMHVKDLQGLRRYSEPPFVTYTGCPVGAAPCSSA